MRNHERSSAPHKSAQQPHRFHDQHEVTQSESAPQLAAMVAQVLAVVEDIRARLAGTHKPWYSVDEIAEATGRSGYTIRRWIKEGRITATRVTGTGPRGRLLVAHDQLTRLIETGLGSEIL